VIQAKSRSRSFCDERHDRKTGVTASFNRYTDFEDRLLLTNPAFHRINETPFNQ